MGQKNRPNMCWIMPNLRNDTTFVLARARWGTATHWRVSSPHGAVIHIVRSFQSLGIWILFTIGYHWLPLVVPILRPWHDCCSSTQPRKAQCQGRSLKHSPSNKALVWFPTNTWCVANRDCNGYRHRLSGRVVRVTIPGDILPVASHKPSRSPSQTTHC